MGNLDQRTLLLVRLKFCEAAARDLQITAPPGGNLQIPVAEPECDESRHYLENNFSR